jgi:hypothetical protein
VTVWALFQIAVDLLVFVSLMALWLRLKRPPQDDPRLSRGLQLLQTKITVLEDLSDRTDNQVKQLNTLIDQKTRLMQNKVLEAEQQVMKIEHSMNKSMEIAEIFQDKIPHQEIMERQQKVEYVRAARLAHNGASVDDIAAQVALPREQIELIAKFNREQLMFDQDRLPEWASRAVDKDQGAGNFALGQVDFINNLDRPNLSSMNQVESQFKQTVQQMKTQEQLHKQSMQPAAVMSMRATAQTLKNKLVSTAEDLLKQQANLQALQDTPYANQGSAAANPEAPLPTTEVRNIMTSQPVVKKVIFPRLDK